MTTLTWQNPKASLLQDQITSLESNLREYKEYISREDNKLVISEGIEYLLERVAKEFIEPLPVDSLNQGNIVKQRVIDIIQRQLQLTTNEVNNTRYSVEQYNQFADNCITQIAALKEQLESIDLAPRTVSQTSIRKALSTVKGIKSPNSILLKEKNNTPFLRFALDSVISSLDSSAQYDCIHSEVGDLHIPISPVIVQINLITGETAITPYTGWSKYAVYKFDGKYSPHPHVLGTYPCLGDFAAPFREAIENQEWLEAVLYIKLFLERIITGDVAGQNWKYYFGGWCSLHINDDFVYHAGKRYTIWQTKQPGYYELRPLDDGPTIPHPANAAFFPGV